MQTVLYVQYDRSETAFSEYHRGRGIEALWRAVQLKKLLHGRGALLFNVRSNQRVKLVEAGRAHAHVGMEELVVFFHQLHDKRLKFALLGSTFEAV